MFELALIIALLGHIGVWCTIFNLVHATAWPRPVRKSLEAIIYLSVAVIGITLVTIHFTAGNLFVFQSGPGVISTAYAWACLFYFGYQLVLWIVARQTSPETRAMLKNDQKVIDTLANSQPAVINDSVARLLMTVPFNQFAKIAIEHKTIFVPKMPGNLDGMRIAHLSDLHFTGKLSPRYFEMAFEHVAPFEPDIICLTGDVVDVDGCLDWIDELFPMLTSRHGKFFILGNHDARISDTTELRRRIERQGFIDVNGCWKSDCVNQTTISLAGNELPWFSGAEKLENTAEAQKGFRVLLSHSPDHAYWANREGFHLVLAGHNHGGQVRFPIVGPVVSPSWYGVRFASGSFLVDEMAMHVSRGLSSDDPIRINCLPELSLLTLSSGPHVDRSHDSDNAINLLAHQS